MALVHRICVRSEWRDSSSLSADHSGDPDPDRVRRLGPPATDWGATRPRGKRSDRDGGMGAEQDERGSANFGASCWPLLSLPPRQAFVRAADSRAGALRPRLFHLCDLLYSLGTESGHRRERPGNLGCPHQISWTRAIRHGESAGGHVGSQGFAPLPVLAPPDEVLFRAVSISPRGKRSGIPPSHRSFPAVSSRLDPALPAGSGRPAMAGPQGLAALSGRLGTLCDHGLWAVCLPEHVRSTTAGTPLRLCWYVLRFCPVDGTRLEWLGRDLETALVPC